MNFYKLTAYIQSLEKQGIPGCEVTIWRNHEPLYRHAQGFSDAGGTHPVTGEEVYWLYSATKVVTCAAALQWVERGALGLDDPVAKYLPAYRELIVREGDGARPARTEMTVRHLFAMQGGLNYNLSSPSVKELLARAGHATTTRQFADALAREPLDFDPGAHFEYSLCHDVLGAVVEVVSGESLGETMRRNLFDPLGMKTASFQMDEARAKRLAARWTYDEAEQTSVLIGPENGLRPDCALESGGAGLISDVDDYIRFADALACGGVGATGARVLRPETVELMRANQQSGACKDDFDALGRSGYGYGLGVRTLIEREKSGAASPLGEFGWDGAAGAYVLIDPVNRVSAFYAQHVMNCGQCFRVIHPRLRDLIYEGLGL